MGLEQMSGTLPEKPLKVGQSFTVNKTMTQMNQNIQMKATSTFMGIKSVSGKQLAEMAIKIAGTGTATMNGVGTSYYNLADGSLNNMNMTTNMTMMVPGQNQKMDMNVSMEMKTIADIAATPATDAVDKELDEIARQGGISPLPPASEMPLQEDGWEGVVIKNDTPYSLKLFYSGPVKTSTTVRSGQNVTLDIPPGTYRIGVQVLGGNVKGLYGQRTFRQGTRPETTYYIKRSIQ